jgi:hypothetical protein
MILALCYLKSRRGRNTTAAAATNPNMPTPPISMAQPPGGMPGLLAWLDCLLPVSLIVGVGLGIGVRVGDAVGTGDGIEVGDGIPEGLGVGVAGCASGVGVEVGAGTTVKGPATPELMRSPVSVFQAHAVHCPNWPAAAGHVNVTCAFSVLGGIATLATVTDGMLLFVQM